MSTKEEENFSRILLTHEGPQRHVSCCPVMILLMSAKCFGPARYEVDSDQQFLIVTILSTQYNLSNCCKLWSC